MNIGHALVLKSKESMMSRPSMFLLQQKWTNKLTSMPQFFLTGGYLSKIIKTARVSLFYS